LVVVVFSLTVLERESEETKEAESSVAALRRQVASQREAIAALDADIEQYRARVANLRKGQSPPYVYYFAHAPTFGHRQSEKWNGKR
jgi:kinetochore protein Spc25, fungi type